MTTSVEVIENWAPLDELAERCGGTRGGPRLTAWPAGRCCSTPAPSDSSTTPALLLALARSVGDRDDVRVVVISEGIGRRLAARRSTEANRRRRLVLLPFQPYEVLAEVLA